MRYPLTLQKLIESLRKLPGVGIRSAERYAFNMLNWSPDDLESFSHLLLNLSTLLKKCEECGCLKEENCHFCETSIRDSKKLCVVATYKDVFAIENTGEFQGHYHVLGSLLSPLDKRGPEKMNLPHLKTRIEKLGSEEILLALDATLEGDATSLFIKRELTLPHIKLSRLAFGVPMGSALEFVDPGTLARALSSRTHVEQ